MTEQPTKWVAAREYYGFDTDPLRGNRLQLKAEQGNAVRDELVKLMPAKEIAKALGGKDAMDRVFTKTGKPEVIRVRADMIGFLKALRARYQHNMGEDISLPNILSMVALHGAAAVVEMPEFQPVNG